MPKCGAAKKPPLKSRPWRLVEVVELTFWVGRKLMGFRSHPPFFLLAPDPKTHIFSQKGDTIFFKREKWSSNHQCSGHMLVFRGESCILEFNVSPFKIPRSELIYPIFCLRTVIPLWLFKKGSGPGSLGPRITETSVFNFWLRNQVLMCQIWVENNPQGGGQEGAYWTHLATS